MNELIRLKYLVQLALIDNKFDNEEMKFIINTGRSGNLSEEEIISVINEGLAAKEFSKDEFEGLSFDQRFEYLVSVIELMKVDGKIFLSEINYCKQVAEKLGFKKEVVANFAAKIHSDPSLSVPWDILKEQIKGSLKEGSD